MGFDVYGVKGNYFRNSYRDWRPLWTYATGECRHALTDEEVERGYHNDALFISEEKALVIGRKLLTLIGYGYTEQTAKEDSPAEALNAISECPSCGGVGYRTHRLNRCESCKGTGVMTGSASYLFTVKNTMNFGHFCIESGGFWIC